MKWQPNGAESSNEGSRKRDRKTDNLTDRQTESILTSSSCNG